MNTVTIETRKAASDREFMIEHHYAYGSECGAIDLDVSKSTRSRTTVTVRWGVRRGYGWRSWCATFRGPEAREKALSFADDKWSVLVAWLEKLEPAADLTNGAVAAFSAQVATMHR